MSNQSLELALSATQADTFVEAPATQLQASQPEPSPVVVSSSQDSDDVQIVQHLRRRDAWTPPSLPSVASMSEDVRSPRRRLLMDHEMKTELVPDMTTTASLRKRVDRPVDHVAPNKTKRKADRDVDALRAAMVAVEDQNDLDKIVLQGRDTQIKTTIATLETEQDRLDQDRQKLIQLAQDSEVTEAEEEEDDIEDVRRLADNARQYKVNAKRLKTLKDESELSDQRLEDARRLPHVIQRVIDDSKDRGFVHDLFRAMDQWTMKPLPEAEHRLTNARFVRDELRDVEMPNSSLTKLVLKEIQKANDVAQALRRAQAALWPLVQYLSPEQQQALVLNQSYQAAHEEAGRQPRFVMDDDTESDRDQE